MSVTEWESHDGGHSGTERPWPTSGWMGVTLGTPGEGGWSRLEEHLMQRPGRVRTPRGREPATVHREGQGGYSLRQEVGISRDPSLTPHFSICFPTHEMG